MTRTADTVITVTACLAAFCIGAIGVTIYAIWDVTKRIA